MKEMPALDKAPDSETAVLEDLPLERLEAEITELSAHPNAAECRWLRLVAEFDRRQGWGTWECRSCAHWLNWKCGIDRPRVGKGCASLTPCVGCPRSPPPSPPGD